MNTNAMPAPAVAPAPMSVFERYLTVWVFLCIVVGIVLGQTFPVPFQAIGYRMLQLLALPLEKMGNSELQSALADIERR